MDIIPLEDEDEGSFRPNIPYTNGKSAWKSKEEELDREGGGAGVKEFGEDAAMEETGVSGEIIGLGYSR